MSYNRTYQIQGEISINTLISPQNEVLSDIRSIEGVTIVKFTPISEGKDDRNHRGILSIKLDTFPFTQFDKETQFENLIEKVRKIQAVNYYRPSDATLLESTKLLSLIKEVLQEKKTKRDRCLRIADRKFDKPSAYKSGAVVRCRRGEIWKDLKESTFDPNQANQKIDNLPPGKIFGDAKNIESIFKKSQHEWSKVVELFEKNKSTSSPQFLDIKDIYITQPNIQSNKVKKLISNFNSAPSINVVEFEDGEKVIYDGHHRLTANWALGNDKVKVNLVKLGSSANTLEEKESLHKWFKRQGTPGKTGGWVDCNSPIRKDGEITGYKPCGRQKGEERAKYPSCRPTPAGCKDKGKGKTWGKTK